MTIAGFEKCSFVDYPGHLAAVVFTSGCNWRCYYCHNRSIIARNDLQSRIGESVVLQWIESRRELLDGVVVTGGEPTLQRDLPLFLSQLKQMGLLVKLDTNGSHPKNLRSLMDDQLLDYVAMDIKAPISKYDQFCDCEIDQSAINESVDLLLLGGVDYEFRTTIVPQLTAADIVAIAGRIGGARKYVLQQYRAPIDAVDDPRLASSPHHPKWIMALLENLQGLVNRVEVRGIDQAVRSCEVA